MSGGEALIAMQAAQQVAGGISANADARDAARAYDQNARITETQGAYDAVDSLRRARLQAGADATRASAGGVGFTGSTGDVLFQNAVEAQMQAMNIRASAGQKARGLKMQAADLRAKGKAALIGSVIGAGATALTGARDQQNQSYLRDALTSSFNSQMGGTTVQAVGSIPIPQQDLSLLPYGGVGW